MIDGLLVLWQKPKAWAMSMGAAASFSALANGPLQLAVILSLAFGGAASVSLVVWCLTGQLLGRVLKRDWQWQALKVTLGLLLSLSIIPMWLD